MVSAPLVPCMTLRLPSDAEILKLGAGMTVSVADCVAPALDADITTAVEEGTAFVATVKDVAVDPAGTVTAAGTAATFVSLLESATCTPALGAGPLRVTVPVEVCAPPTTFVGFNVKEMSVGAGTAIGACSKNMTEGWGSVSEMPTNCAGEIM